MFCFDCCKNSNVKQYPCFKCTGSNYILHISKFYKENKKVFNRYSGEIITHRETVPMKCDNCESFYYNNMIYKCDCGVVFKIYCDSCCSKHDIKVNRIVSVMMVLIRIWFQFFTNMDLIDLIFIK